MALQLNRYRFTVAEYDRMIEAGIFGEDDRVELIDGEILQMSPIGQGHASVVRRMNWLLMKLVGDAAIVDVQNPIHLDEYGEPRPDLALLAPRSDFYREDHPDARDVLLLIEVADSSLDFDRQIKLPRYARAGIPEVWLVNLNADLVEVHRDPMVDGYRTVEVRRRGEWLTPLAFPGHEVAVTEILG